MSKLRQAKKLIIEELDRIESNGTVTLFPTVDEYDSIYNPTDYKSIFSMSMYISSELNGDLPHDDVSIYMGELLDKLNHAIGIIENVKSKVLEFYNQYDTNIANSRFVSFNDFMSNELKDKLLMINSMINAAKEKKKDEKNISEDITEDIVKDVREDV
jgi:hypothetical protein